VARQTRERVVEVIVESRGRVGVPSLKQAFSEVPRARLRRLLAAYRRLHARRGEHLVWTTPGTVWAADFTEVAPPIEGRYANVLNVRDLASGRQLLALPAECATAHVADAALEALTAAHGAPLVLKTDNGSPFTAQVVVEDLEHTEVAHLRSPPGMAPYNGSVEAGIGSLQTRLQGVSSSRGRAASPTCDDLEEARLEANAEARPWGPNGPSPDERWHERAPITPAQRRAFQAVLAEAQRDELRRFLQRSGSGPPQPTSLSDLNDTDRAMVARRSIRRALLQSGYLIIRSTTTSSTHLTPELTEN
jgi:hypothetical protein